MTLLLHRRLVLSGDLPFLSSLRCRASFVRPLAEMAASEKV